MKEIFDESIYVEDNDGIVTVHNLDKVSFHAQLALVPTKISAYYNMVSNELMSFRNVLNRTYVGKDCYYLGYDTIGKFNIVEGKLYFYIKIAPEIEDRVYNYITPKHDVNENEVYTQINLINNNTAKHACDLIHILMNNYKVGKI